MSRSQLLTMAKGGLAHSEAGTIEQAEGVFKVPASQYYDPGHWQLELDRVFKRLPLMLATK